MKKKALTFLLVCALVIGLTISASAWWIFGDDKKEEKSGQEKIILKGTFAAPKARWDWLISRALEKLNEKYPDKKIEMDYQVLPYDKAHDKLTTMMVSKTSRDLISLDCIWLGEFAEGGFLKDISSQVKDWGRMDDYYSTYQKGSKYNNKYYGIWSWTDVRVLWYWPDLLKKANVKPENLNTWDEYIKAANKLDKNLSEGIEPVHLVGASHSPDMFYPYLWMNGGKILEKRNGKWYPAFHKEAGVKALNFIKRQVNNGVKPQQQHFWGQEFADKRFAVMLEGSWVPGKFSSDLTTKEIENKIGMLPLFPTPKENMETATMSGGWMLGIPKTSEHQKLAWELMKIIQSPEMMSKFSAKFGYLPTQKIVANKPEYNQRLKENIPFFEKYKEILPHAYGRPQISEYPQIAEQIRLAIEEVYYNDADPEEALTEAAKEVAKILGWSGLKE